MSESNQNYLQILEVTLKMDEQKQPYKYVRVAEFEKVGDEFIATGNISARVLRPARVIGEYSFSADTHYNTIEVGKKVKGGICHFNTTPYSIGERVVSKYSCVVFANEEPVRVANNNLRTQKACVIDEYGQLTNEDQTLGDVTVTASSSQSAPEVPVTEGAEGEDDNSF